MTTNTHSHSGWTDNGGQVTSNCLICRWRRALGTRSSVETWENRKRVLCC
jgi:hypothetical protein